MLKNITLSASALFLLSSCTMWHTDCHNFFDIKVKKVYEDGVIASSCQDSFWEKDYFCKNSQDIFLLKNHNNIYYDGQKIDIPGGMCPLIIGSKQIKRKTYPIVTIQSYIILSFADGS